jgi:uncharacterized membrane protein
VLRFCNQYTTTVSVCIEWYRPGCPDGGDWEKAGWWVMQPGECKTAFGGDVDDVNRYWYYFAFATDGAVWAGEFNETVPDRVFDWCSNTSSTDSRTVGMRQLDVGDSDNYIVNLTP